MFVLRPNKKIPLFPVSRPTLIFTPDPSTFYRIWVGQRKRRRKTSRRSQCLHNKEWNLNAHKLQFKTKKAVNDLNSLIIKQSWFSLPWSWMMILTSVWDSKKKKIFQPTYPNFLGHVTGNTHTSLFGLSWALKKLINVCGKGAHQ